ncbi:MAG: orotidine-5'-phosphate decarboxylase [Planctomycetes bacterium]|nr:orotidine-5'-phosphate decarboxylase [Planctomycetota bacterium]MCC7172624.1 orotidine-5'-phosphate decarboxylase [Planctomycetota bacterium]
MQLFAERLHQRCRELRSSVVVGLDPKPNLLSSRQEHDGKASTRALARSYVAFARDIVDAVADVALAIKVQVACYEALGLPGIRAYVETLRAIKARGIPVIGDIKRGDIGISSAGYLDGHFGRTAKAGGYDADAVTLSPYLGFDTIEPWMEACRTNGKGLFLLVRTSNPSARDLQDLIVDGAPLYASVARLVDRWGEPVRGSSGYSSIGAVVGATYPAELLAIRRAHPTLWILVPGYGAQGGTAADVAPAFDADGAGLLVSSSRGILAAYRESEKLGVPAVEHVRRAALSMRDDLLHAWRR